jgi:hypothetical protein
MDDIDTERAAWASTKIVVAEQRAKVEKLEMEIASLKKQVEDITNARDIQKSRSDQLRSWWNEARHKAIAPGEKNARLEVQNAKYRMIAEIVKESEEKSAAT